LIRIPAARGSSTRVELRCPDPACNPYLALAAILTAGLDGIENKIEPPASTDKNIFSMSAAERKEEGILSLPDNLKEAVDELAKSPLALEVMGKHIFEKFIEAKNEEWGTYITKVSEWELGQYLTKF